jgi:peptidoglycan-N-acetylglucosamine deacetylase
MPKLTIVTTSWDDGDPADLRLAELLSSRGLSGTFYVPMSYDGRPVLSSSQLRALASGGFEVGGHGLHHWILTRLRPEDIVREVGGCKKHLEDLLGEKVRMFCYPQGRYNSAVLRCLSEAGYEGARTTRMLFTDLGFGRFEMPTSLQAYPHKILTYMKNTVKGRNLKGLREALIRPARKGNWIELGKRLFDRVLQDGGMWHLFGHSWEIETLGLWKGLRELLDYVSRRTGVVYKTNGAMFKVLKEESRFSGSGSMRGQKTRLSDSGISFDTP